MIIRLPFPAAELFPNKKNGKHWASTHSAKSKQRDDAFYITKQERALQAWEDVEGYIPISLLYLTPDRRHRDGDNMLAATKGALDGVAQALGVDDKRFKPILIDWTLGPKEGCLILAVGVQIKSGVNLG